jgi:hypothetical protein
LFNKEIGYLNIIKLSKLPFGLEDMKGRYPGLLFVLAVIQGLYFIIAGLWPLLNIQSFVAIAGPKTDIWLVKTVGLLITITGVGLLSATLRNRLTMEVIFMAILTAGGLAFVDIYYAWNDVISEIYLLDAAAEFFLILCWFLLLLTKPSQKRKQVKTEEVEYVERE